MFRNTYTVANAVENFVAVKLGTSFVVLLDDTKCSFLEVVFIIIES